MTGEHPRIMWLVRCLQCQCQVYTHPDSISFISAKECTANIIALIFSFLWPIHVFPAAQWPKRKWTQFSDDVFQRSIFFLCKTIQQFFIGVIGWVRERRFWNYLSKCMKNFFVWKKSHSYWRVYNSDLTLRLEPIEAVYIVKFSVSYMWMWNSRLPLNKSFRNTAVEKSLKSQWVRSLWSDHFVIEVGFQSSVRVCVLLTDHWTKFCSPHFPRPASTKIHWQFHSTRRNRKSIWLLSPSLWCCQGVHFTHIFQKQSPLL